MNATADQAFRDDFDPIVREALATLSANHRAVIAWSLRGRSGVAVEGTVGRVADVSASVGTSRHLAVRVARVTRTERHVVHASAHRPRTFP